MAKKYSQSQLDQIYEKLPEELKEAIFSVETAENIGETCESYGITDNRVGEIADHVGHVLMGLLLPQEFAGVLEREVKLSKTPAELIARDLNRLIFFPIRPALEQLHRMEIEVSAKVVTPETPAQEQKESKQNPPEEPRKPNSYQEPIE